MNDKTFDFGFDDLDQADEKTERVKDVFRSVANQYDIMNDLMSLGLHRIWKQALIDQIRPRPHDILLDVAGGTGDISHAFIRHGGKKSIICDITEDMVKAGRNNIIDNQTLLMNGLDYTIGNAENLPFKNDMFDVVNIAFGLRNVSQRELALQEMHRVLKPGGRFVCLEFSHVQHDTLAKIYDYYGMKILPKLGKIVAKDESSYRYLSESIRRFPSAKKLCNMIEQAGFIQTNWIELSAGVVAIHKGWKV